MEQNNFRAQEIFTESNAMVLIADPVTEFPIIGTRK